jgi:hypothetical protein
MSQKLQAEQDDGIVLAGSAAQESTSGLRPSRASSDGAGEVYKTSCEPKRGFMDNGQQVRNRDRNSMLPIPPLW